MFSCKCNICNKQFISINIDSHICSMHCKNCKTFDDRNDNPEAYFKVRIKGGKRSNTNARSELSVDFLPNLLNEKDGKCDLSGQTMTFKSKLGQGRVNTNASIDQIQAGGGYTKDNVQLVCDIVNRMKLDMNLDELEFWCSKILGG